MNRFVASIFFLVCILLSACTETSSSRTPADNAEADSVFAKLQDMDREAFRTAFQRLSEYSYLRRTRTTQFDADGEIVAVREHVMQHAAGAPGASRMTLADSAGGFRFGYLAGFVDPAVTTFAPDSSFFHNILPEELPFLTARHREGFQYHALGDTLMGDQSARVIEVVRKPEYADRYALRRIHLYLARDSDRLVAVRVHRTNETSFFNEKTRLYAQLQRTGGEWLPEMTRVTTSFQAPLHATRRFQTVAEYDFGRD